MRRVLLAVAGGGGSFAVDPQYPPTGAVWTRSAGNPIIVATETWESPTSGDGWVLEPTVIYENGTFRMWYTGGADPNYGMGYASCTGDPLVAANWTKYASNPVLGQGGSSYAGKCSRNAVFRIDNTLHCYFSNTLDLLHSTSTDGLSWATPTTVLTRSQFTGSPTQLTNSFIWKEGANDWRMLVEPVGGTWVDQMAYCTSTDGLSWTIQNGGNPLSDLMPTGQYSAGGPWIVKEGPKYHLWYVSTQVQQPPNPYESDLWYSSSTDLLSWTTPAEILTHQGSGTIEYDQVSDPCVIVVAGTAYLFYDADNNTANEGGPWFKIAVASAPAVYSMG